MQKIYLSPSNQPANKYVAGNTNEKAQMEAVAAIVKDKLEQGYECAVVMATLSLGIGDNERPAEAKNKGCGYYIAIHSNAANNTPPSTATGAVAFFHPQQQKGKDIATEAVKELNAACPIKSNRASQVASGMTQFNGSGYGEIRSPYNKGLCPVLIEVNFHDNPQTAQYIIDNHTAIAEAIVKAIVSALGIPKKNIAPPAGGLTKIEGKSAASVAQMKAYLLSKNAAAEQYANTLPQIFLTEGEKEGIRGDIAFAQSCLETGNFKFGGDVKPEKNNFAGIGATGGGVSGNCFATPEEGVRAQIQHLKAYANAEPLKNACVDPRFNYVTRGSAAYVEWLGIQENPNGKGWASGAGYGSKILNILADTENTKVTVEQPPAGMDNTPEEWERAAVEKAIAKGVLSGDGNGNLRLHSSATRAEVLVILDKAGLL